MVAPKRVMVAPIEIGSIGDRFNRGVMVAPIDRFNRGVMVAPIEELWWLQ